MQGGALYVASLFARISKIYIIYIFHKFYYTCYRNGQFAEVKQRCIHYPQVAIGDRTY